MTRKVKGGDINGSDIDEAEAELRIRSQAHA